MGKWRAAFRCFTAVQQTKKTVTPASPGKVITASWSVYSSTYTRTSNPGIGRSNTFRSDTGQHLVFVVDGPVSITLITLSKAVPGASIPSIVPSSGVSLVHIRFPSHSASASFRSNRHARPVPGIRGLNSTWLLSPNLPSVEGATKGYRQLSSPGTACFP